MTDFEWFLLIVVVLGVPLVVAVIVTLWTIDQARKRNRQNRSDAQVGVKRRATVEPAGVPARSTDGDSAPGTPTEEANKPPDVSRETSVPVS